MNPTPEQIAAFFRTWIQRYNFGITLDDIPGWVDPSTGKRLRRNHVICLMINDLKDAFPEMRTALARKVSGKTIDRIESFMTSKIKAGGGSQIDVSDTYL